VSEVLKGLLDRADGMRALVVGDLIYDEFVWGEVTKVSPEAPVQVLDWQSSHTAPGGAANVASNLATMGVDVTLVGVIGQDDQGLAMKNKLKAAGIDTLGVIADPNRPTTHKVRFIAHAQQILRMDREQRRDLDPPLAELIGRAIREALPHVEGVIMSDYLKGVLTEEIIQLTITEARSQGKRVIVDPKGRQYESYRGSHIITPNVKEVEEATGVLVEGEDDLKRAAAILFERVECENVLVTRGKEGMSLFHLDGSSVHIPTQARDVFDVTGAGDTAVAVFGLGAFAGAPLEEAARLANIGAGIVVGKVGTSVATKEEIVEYLEEGYFYSARKIIPLDEVSRLVRLVQGKNQTVVFTNGCFDILHAGHIMMLHRARSFGDMLVLGLNSDESVRSLKGPQRPIIGQEDRAKIIASLDCVDYVVIFDELTPERMIKELVPDVLVKGGDYSLEEVVGREIVEDAGGRVELVPILEGWSTSDLVQRIAERYNLSGLEL
jgi:D-beta-D-heptose 7-phosphate kinase/D-beta-D-heptose 1-phosphate adenosyltransferase